MKELLDRFEKFIRNIKTTDRIAVVHHTDSDGVCSGVIIGKVIERLRNKMIDLRLNQNHDEIPISQDTIHSLKQNRINKVIITDMCVDQEYKKIKEMEKFAEILVLDHHKQYHDLNSGKTIMIKSSVLSKNINSASYCASKLAYDIFSRIMCIDDLDWISVVGIIGDCAGETWSSFVNETFRKYHIRINGDLFKTDLGRIANIISAVEAQDIQKIKDCFDALYNAKDYREFLKSDVVKYEQNMKKELDYWKNNTEKLAEFYPDIDFIFYLIKPKYHVKSALSTILSFRYPDKTIVIAQDTNDRLLPISARRRDYKIAVNDLLEKAIKSLKDAEGGGHIPAAGGRIRREDLDVFKKNLIKLLKDKKS